MADSEQKTEPTPYRPLSSVNPAELAAQFDQQEGTPAPAPAAPEPAKAVEAKPPVSSEKPVSEVRDEAPQLLKIAQERAAFRKEVEAAKPYMEVLKAFSPQEAQRLAQARAQNNPVAALQALGFTHSQYTSALLGQQPEQPSEQPPAPAAKQDNSELAQLRAELQALKAERDTEKTQTARQQAMSQMKQMLSADQKFKHINGLENYDAVERVLIDYHSQHGSLPGATFEESVKLAAEVVEANLAKEAEKWSRVLTVSPTSAPLSAQKAPESKPSSGTATPRTLTNAAATAPAEVKTVPKTRQELIQAYIERGEDALT